MNLKIKIAKLLSKLPSTKYKTHKNYCLHGSEVAYKNLNEVSRYPDASISPCTAACSSAVIVGLLFKSFLYLPHYIHTSLYRTILCYYSIIRISILRTFNYPEQIFALIKIAIMHVMSHVLYILNLYIGGHVLRNDQRSVLFCVKGNLENVSSSSEAKV